MKVVMSGFFFGIGGSLIKFIKSLLHVRDLLTYVVKLNKARYQTYLNSIKLPARNQLASTRYSTFCKRRISPSIWRDKRARRNVFVDRGRSATIAPKYPRTVAEAHRCSGTTSDDRSSKSNLSALSTASRSARHRNS